MILQRKTNFK